MNATTLMVITVALVSAVSWVVRYRILNMYSRLPPEPQRKEPEIDLFPDTHDEGVKSGLSSYLDEFLSAIKIFGYLERPVFHELTRSMQTRKLIAGETFNLEEEKGFCIVVDGMVEIFVKSGRSFGSPEASANSEGDPLDGEDDALPHGEQYQLLTEVKNGAPMSSLFSIMSLFTEDIKLTSTEAETPVRSTASSANYRFSGVARTSVSRHVSQDAAASMPGTPRFVDVAENNNDRKAMFGNHNAFGIMDPFDGSVDGDTESLTSGGLALNTPPSAQSLANDLRDDAEIVFFPQGSVLVEQGERNPGLYYVIDGFLDICTTSEESSASILQPGVRASTAGLTSGATPAPDHNIHGRDNAQDKRKKSVRRSVSLIKPGGLAGYIGALSSYRSFIDVVAKTDVYVGFLPRASLERIVDRYPIILLTMAKRLTSLLPRLLLHIDFALDWDQVSAGQVIFHNGDESEAIYIVLNGRLRLVEDREGGGMTARAEFGQGDSVAGLSALGKGSSALNLRTVAVLPVTAGVPVVEFGHRLLNALVQVGPVNGAISLNQSAILNHLGKHAFNKMGKLKLSQYLADLEEKYGLVVYVADTNVNSPWTQTCIAQADSILLVGLGEGSPEIGEYERFMLGMKSTARKILVLLHAERYSSPGLTRSWLRNRMWINGGHYHLQMAFRTNMMPSHPPSKRSNTTLKERVQILQAEIQKYTSRKVRHTPYYSPDAPFKGDFHRLARRLCGKSVGLVLGGGGARGITQIGIIQAMEEAGIPIDVVGGTSMGSFVGALYARHADIVPIFGLAKKFSGRMASMWRFALDLTYPTSSYTTGHEFNRGIFKTFGKAQIEDFWLEFYCNTTNISKSRAEYHTSGYAWRYIRASMSLAGLLPPLSDEGSMLLDGGYIDNLTVSHMKRLGVDTIFAVDVGSLDDDTPQSYGDSLSGVWAFFNRWNPFSTTPNPPTLAEIQARLAYVSSVDALERAKAMPGCLYMRPPIDDYGTLDFGKFDEIYQVGYKYGQEFLQKMKDDGVLPLVEETEAKKALRRTMAPRRASI
ncbi:hypothetical protein VDGE_10436 [Verticillium dahliae]|uniref:Lysophospholipase NTE1 n=1 Tax=Verticillium dahliae TaxID=27337 RepID=A0A444RU56_VERDA|nr:hypothetical protein VDGE_10436 [Verticillium dahliae]